MLRPWCSSSRQACNATERRQEIVPEAGATAPAFHQDHGLARRGPRRGEVSNAETRVLGARRRANRALLTSAVLADEVLFVDDGDEFLGSHEAVALGHEFADFLPVGVLIEDPSSPHSASPAER